MREIIIKSFTYLFVILLAYIMKKRKVLRYEDYEPFSKLAFYVTTPCLIISGFQEFHFEKNLIICIIFGFLINLAIIACVLVCTRRKDTKKQALYIMTSPTFNIGSMILPFLIGVYPGQYLSYLFMFDIGNAVMCTGLIYAIAKSKIDYQSGVSFKSFMKSLLSSIPFTTYIVLLMIKGVGLTIPNYVFDIAGQIGSASVIVVMFMLGLMLDLQLEKEDLKDITEIFVIRYVVIALFAFVVNRYYSAPDLGKQVVILCMLAPLTSLTPVFCSRLKLKSSVYSFVSSISMPISILLVMLCTYLWQ